MWVAFAVQKLLTFFQQKISEYCIYIFFFFFDLGFTALSRIFHLYRADCSSKVGENRRTRRKTTWPSVSRTWLSHIWPELRSNHSGEKPNRILYIESAKTVNEMTLNELVNLTTLWTTGPSMLSCAFNACKSIKLPFLSDTRVRENFSKSVWHQSGKLLKLLIYLKSFNRIFFLSYVWRSYGLHIHCVTIKIPFSWK